jgi:hypothetical protein
VLRALADQVRMLLIAWLLLTLPVVCHHQTAVMVVGALAGGPSHVHGASGSVHGHAGHGSVQPTDPSSGPVASAAVLDAHGAEWCAHLPSTAGRGLPEGLDNFALVARVPLGGPHGPGLDAGWSDLSPPLAEQPPPPAPPPRLALV